ncbi:MAG: hypothetical protein WC467_00585 [Patescibacteria group bacterium]
MKRNVLVCNVFIGIFAVILVIALAINSSAVNSMTSYIAIAVSCASLFFGVFLFILASYLKLSWWNGLSVYGRAEELASELKAGKRDWYLNPMPLGQYIFAPLRPNKLNELGGGNHIETNRLNVVSLLAEGKIDNSEITRLIIYHFDSIL